MEPEGSYPPVRLAKIEIWVCRAPIERPVETSFGTMSSRPGLFVRLEDIDGAFGFGEVWCNFPACGAEHRANLIVEELAPLITGSLARHPSDLFHLLSDKIHIRALQAGELGPYAQAIAGLDIAMWDLFARRADVSVRHFLNPDAVDAVCAYASGIDIRQAQPLISAERNRGHRAFKVKVGFEMNDDISMTHRIVLGLERGERLFADANQAWDLPNALLFTKKVAHAGLGWIEEPMASDTPLGDWRSLAGASAIPLAAGENIAGLDQFSQAIAGAGLSFIQPDLAKWGGVSGCLQVAGYAAESGVIYCPHYLGGGIGLCASAHFLAAIGGNGLLEIDTNRNPLRQEIWDPHLDRGKAVLGKMVGLGIERLPESILQFTTHHCNLPFRGASYNV